MSIFQTARRIYAARKHDPDFMDTVRAAIVALSDDMITNGNSGMLIASSMVNGQSFTADNRRVNSPEEQLAILSLILKMDDMGEVPPSETRAVFI